MAGVLVGEFSAQQSPARSDRTATSSSGLGLHTDRLRVHLGSTCAVRYNLISNLTVLGERFEFDPSQLTLESADNVAPTQDVLTVIGGESRRAGFMRWGLIPFWARDRSIGSRMINARAETVADKPSFRDGFQTQALPRARRRLLRVAAHAVRQAPCAHRLAVGRSLRRNVVQKRNWRA